MNNKNQKKLHEYLRNLYFAELEQPVYYDGKVKPKVRHVDKWKNIPDTFVESIDLEPNLENIWVWSDQHFSHNNIIKYANRPFKNTYDMECQMIKNNNSVVGKDDMVIWGGDVSFCNNDHTDWILKQCNGHKLLIIGNHDVKKGYLKDMNFNMHCLVKHMYYKDIDLVFSHYPMNDLPEGFINVHGHVHAGGNDINDNYSRHINVNLEFWDYTPINMAKIIEIARGKI